MGLRNDYCRYAVDETRVILNEGIPPETRFNTKQLRAQKEGLALEVRAWRRKKETSCHSDAKHGKYLNQVGGQQSVWQLSYGEMTGPEGQLQRCSRISRSTRPGDPNFEEPRRVEMSDARGP